MASANLLSVLIEGMEVPLSSLAIEDWEVPILSASSFCDRPLLIRLGQKVVGGNTAIATEAHLGACCIASSQTLGNKCQYQGIERHALSFRPGCQLKVHGAGEPCKDFA